MGRAVEKKRKKKGRPSLLDLQKRSLRLQKQLEQQQQQKRNPNPNLSTNPYARFPRPPADRSPVRWKSIPDPEPFTPEQAGDGTAATVSANDDNDEDEHAERRKEKKLKHVLHLPNANTNSFDLASSASESDNTAPKKRKIDSVRKSESKKSSRTLTETPQEEKSDLGPTTPLPDKKLLEFILDRLQKKDTYGVFSEPVDPEELPDYHDIIKHPMDFGTVRKRLSSGAYQNLEQFEKDVFLISSNAMCYNAPDTVYFRQARSIQELAKKSFENLRQESDDSEPEPKIEPKIVRRGRPPGTCKNNIRRPVGRPPERVGFDCSSEASLATTVNGNFSFSPNYDSLGKGSGLHKQREDVSARGSDQNAERNEDYPGSAWKGSTKYGKKLSYTDENRRNTYKEFQVSSSMLQLTDGERKILVPVGLHFEYSYARSLARFASNLGPTGWKIAAQRIEKVLPPGTKFGRGWVGESDAPWQPSVCPPSFLDPSHRSSVAIGDESSTKQEDLPFQNLVGQGSYYRTSIPPSSASLSAVAPDRCLGSNDHGPLSQLHHNRNMPLCVDEFKAPFTPEVPLHCPPRGGSNLSSSCGHYSFRLPQQQFNSSMPCSPTSRWGEGCQPSS